MSEHYLEIDSFILIFFFFYFYFKKLNKKPFKTIKKFPLFLVTKCSSNFQHSKNVNNGDLVSFKCKGEIICLEMVSDFTDFLLNDDFYQINYLKYINKNVVEK